MNVRHGQHVNRRHFGCWVWASLPLMASMSHWTRRGVRVGGRYRSGPSVLPSSLSSRLLISSLVRSRRLRRPPPIPLSTPRPDNIDNATGLHGDLRPCFLVLPPHRRHLFPARPPVVFIHIPVHLTPAPDALRASLGSSPSSADQVTLFVVPVGISVQSSSGTGEDMVCTV